MPVVLNAGGGAKVALAESDVEDYPGLWFHGTGGPGLIGTFPPYPLRKNSKEIAISMLRKLPITSPSPTGTRTFPWRIIGIVDRDADLLTNQIVYLLAKPSQLQDTSWIKPGKVAWDWWNANNVYGVDFKSGINTQTYKYYIDFAAKYGIEYIILDEGWYKLGNVLEVVPEINMEEMTAYGKQKNVGIILWVVWKTLDDQFDPALDQFEKWGVKASKLISCSAMTRLLINFYHRVCREAAKRTMLVDFHGAITTGDDDSHLAKPDQYRRRSRDGMEQVE